jgi:hypothetical protein
MAPRRFLFSYNVINLIFIIILLSVIAYSFLFTPERNNYPIHFLPGLIKSKPLISTGLSRSFSKIVRFRFSEAMQYNPYGLRIFLFFLTELVMRAFYLLASSHVQHERLKYFVFSDVFISVVLFFICFWPFIMNIWYLH